MGLRNIKTGVTYCVLNRNDPSLINIVLQFAWNVGLRLRLLCIHT